MISSVLDARQRLVDGEHVGDVSCALGPDKIAVETAKEWNKCGQRGMSRRQAMSRAADTVKKGVRT